MAGPLTVARLFGTVLLLAVFSKRSEVAFNAFSEGWFVSETGERFRRDTSRL